MSDASTTGVATAPDVVAKDAAAPLEANASHDASSDGALPGSASASKREDDAGCAATPRPPRSSLLAWTLTVLGMGLLRGRFSRFGLFGAARFRR